MKELYVVNCCRTAVGSFGGSLKNTPAAELGSIVVKEALKRANVAPENVDELMFGCILTAGLGQNVARQVGVGAGLPYSVPAYTVGMVCGSGMKSVIEAGRAILAGDADIIVCGGTENMSAAPFASFDERWGARMGDKKLVDTMIKDGLWDAFNNYHMGTTAENICDVWGITRQELDEFGAASQQKAEAASLFAHWLTEKQRNLDFVTSTGYMPVRNGAFDSIDEVEFADQGYVNLYAALKTMQETYTPLAEVRFTDYYSKVHTLYDGLRQMQQELPRRAAAGEDVETLAEETWALFRSIQ